MAGDLTSEQQAVVALSPDAKAVVTAAAGTGKTRVLIERLRHLIEVCGLSPGQEILVLSFTRSAVGVIRERVAEAGGDVRYVRAATFDSFATRLLSEFDANGSWTGQEYDARIAAATRLITQSPEARQSVGRYRHVLVDEIQDLVSERSDLVKAILGAESGGFTLFGDPAQGIYNFQLDGDARKMGSQELYRWLEQVYDGSLCRPTLTTNFRALTAATKAVLWAGPELASPHPDYESIRFKLDSAVLGLPAADPLCMAAKSFLAGGLPTAVLCRTNGQALLISRALFGCGVPHRLQRLATDHVVARWVALAFRGVQHQAVGRKVFRARMEELAAAQAGVPSPDAAWSVLKRIDRRYSDDLHLPTIASAIRLRNTPVDLTDVPAAVLTVSTIHRAKGLEFQRVVMVDFSDAYADDDLTTTEETRVLYVGLTRPQSDLLRLASPDTKWLRSRSNPGDRWVRRQFGWKTLEFEVRGDDVHSADPAGAFMVEGVSVADTQDYIADQVRPGDALQLELIGRANSGSPRAYYAVKHRGRIVGVSSERFANLLHQTLKINSRWEVRWPVRFDDVHVECVDTVAGTEGTSLKSGLGASGIWLRVRPFGLAGIVHQQEGSIHVQ